MSHDDLTANNLNSASRFRADVQAADRKILHETRADVYELHGQMINLKDLLEALREDLHEIRQKQKSDEQWERAVIELQRWAKSQEVALQAAANLSEATRGARFVLTLIFAVSTGILAVAGVLQMFSGAWQRLWQ